MKQTPVAYFKKAVTLVLNNKSNEAVTYFKLLHSRYSTYPLGASGLLGAAVLYDLKGDFPAAHKSYKDFLKEYPSSYFLKAVKNRFLELDSGLKTANPIILRKFTKIYINSEFPASEKQYLSFIRTFPKFSWNIKLKQELAKYYILTKRPEKAEKILISALNQSLHLSDKYKLNEITDATFKILAIRGNYSQLYDFSTKLKDVNPEKAEIFKSAGNNIKIIKLTGFYSIPPFILILMFFIVLKYGKNSVFPLISSILLIITSYVLRHLFVASALFVSSEILLTATLYFKINNPVLRYTTLFSTLIFIPFHLLLVSGYFPWILFA